MQKDFVNWHEKKTIINNKTESDIFFSEREIWWTSIGSNIRYEQDGKHEDYSRPVLIIRKFNQYIFYAIPLSTTDKRGPYYHEFQYRDDIKSVALLSQMRVLDSSRLIKKDGKLNKTTFREIRDELVNIITKV